MEKIIGEYGIVVIFLVVLSFAGLAWRQLNKAEKKRKERESAK